MKSSFSVKFALLIVLCITVVSVSIFVTAYYFLVAGFDEQVVQELHSRQKAVQAKLEGLKKQALSESFLMASDLNVVLAVENNDSKGLQVIAKAMVDKSSADFLTITNSKGVVVARGHSPKIGDSVTNQLAVTYALEGRESVGLEEGTVVKLSVRAGAPIFRDGKVIGAVSVGKDLGTHEFVDQVKQDMGVECTIFQGDTRFTTSILKDGKRVIGTKMDNPNVLRTVYQLGQTFQSRNVILGITYDTVYWPLISADGKAGCMLFIGKDRESIVRSERSIALSIVVSASVVGLFMVLLGLFLARGMTKPINTAVQFADKVSHGNLDVTLDVRRKDEIGVLADALRCMVESIKNKIAEAERKSQEANTAAEAATKAQAQAHQALEKAEAARREGMLAAADRLEDVAQGIGVASTQLSRQVEVTSDDMHVQEQRTGEAGSAMAEMNSTVLEVARSASQAANQADQAKSKALEGEKVVANVVDAIGQVDKLASELEGEMTVLGEQARSIGGIMSVISDIADQTNLLALNAAIEAARAGEAGRGFAVVADEVRKLAEKTMTATKEVGEAIRSIQQGTITSVGRVKTAAEAAKRATALAGESGQALHHIVSLVEETSHQVQSIAAAAEEQSASSEEINRIVEEVSRITSSTAQGMRDASMGVGNLSDKARELQEIILSFRSEDQGRGVPTRRALGR